MKNYTLLFFILIPAYISSQTSQPHFEQFLTEHGLPSREVYVSHQDKDGYMWFGTDNGIAKYDGYEFTTYNTTTVYEDNVINAIVEDRNGRLWFGSMFGGIYYFVNDSILPFRHNSIFNKYKGKFITCTFEYISKDDKFYFGLFDLGILEIEINGGHKIYSSDNASNYVIKEIENRVFGTRSLPSKNGKQSVLLKNGLKYIDKNNKSKLFKFNLIPTGYERFFNLKHSKDEPIYFYIDRLCFIKDGKLGFTEIREKINNILIDDENKIYLSFGNNKGITITNHEEIVRNKISLNYIRGQTTSHILFDNKKGMWVTTINNGVFYTRIPSVKVWKVSGNDNSEFVSSIAPVNEVECYFSSGIGKIHLVKNDKINSLPDFPLPAGYCSDMEFIDNRLYAYAGYFMDNKWNLIYQLEKPKLAFTFKEISHIKNTNLIWVTNYRGFGSIEKTKNIINYQALLYDHKFTRIYDVLVTKNGNVWLASQDGLKLFNNNKVENILENNAIINSRINTLSQGKNDIITIGSKDHGLLNFNPKTKEIIVINKLMSIDYIRNLYTDDFDNVWVSTNKGLNKVYTEKDKYRIRKFTKAHGLPTEEIYQCKKIENTLWIATTGGLVKFTEPPVDSLSPKPKIITIQSKIGNINATNTYEFKHNDNNIFIYYKTTNYRLLNNIYYRIKSNLDSEWRYTKSTQMELTGLQSGNYYYELQSANEDEIWSESSIITFTIKTPWWKSLYFFLIVILAIISMLYFIYNSRTKRTRQEVEFNSKINKLEIMALQTQMNPHFISNVFASLQYLINTKKLKLAEEYLTDLSSLIRRILENSRKAEVNLKQEMELLKLYIHLEKIRFENKFNSIILIDENINLEGTFIPPMMLQPIIENAINHGLHHLEDRNGELKIEIKNLNDSILISIDDNGIGREKAMKISSLKPHKSFALDILKERILNLNKSSKDKVKLDIIDRNQINEFGTLVKLEFNK